jgi:hypothetical protein
MPGDVMADYFGIWFWQSWSLGKHAIVVLVVDAACWFGVLSLLYALIRKLREAKRNTER